MSFEQVHALYKDSLYGHSPVMDQEGRLRADYKELAPEVQDRVKQLWDQVSNDNLYELTVTKRCSCVSSVSGSKGWTTRLTSIRTSRSPTWPRLR